MYAFENLCWLVDWPFLPIFFGCRNRMCENQCCFVDSPLYPFCLYPFYPFTFFTLLPFFTFFVVERGCFKISVTYFNVFFQNLIYAFENQCWLVDWPFLPTFFGCTKSLCQNQCCVLILFNHPFTLLPFTLFTLLPI